MDLQRGSEGTGHGYAKWFEAKVGHRFAKLEVECGAWLRGGWGIGWGRDWSAKDALLSWGLVLLSRAGGAAWRVVEEGGSDGA
jgi:hypothetical protein